MPRLNKPNASLYAHSSDTILIEVILSDSADIGDQGYAGAVENERLLGYVPQQTTPLILMECIAMDNASRKWKWLRASGVILLVAAVTLGVMYLVRVSNREMRETLCVNNLRQIGMGLHGFNQSTNHLPRSVYIDKDGWPLSSWRFRLIPFLESCMFEFDHDGRWDSVGNVCLCESLWSTFCLGDKSDDPACLETNVVAVTGQGTPWDEKTITLDDLSPDTILAIGIAHSGIHWMEPGDISINELPKSITQGIDGDGVHVLFMDGTVWKLGPNTPLDVLKTFCTIEGAKTHDRNQLLAPYAIRRKD
jgi:hypothetical protein